MGIRYIFIGLCLILIFECNHSSGQGASSGGGVPESGPGGGLGPYSSTKATLKTQYKQEYLLQEILMIT